MPPALTLLLCLVTSGVSLWAFKDRTVLDRLMFRPEAILRYGQWDRLLSSALIHADGKHLLFNMLSLYLFGSGLEAAFGPLVLAVIYVASVLGGSLISLYLHRHHDYSALGASGGVCGVIFAAIFMMPGLGVGMFLIPISVPGPVYAIGYLGWTFYAMRRQIGNIGHDAHFGGAITGLILAAIITPHNCLASPVMFTIACGISLSGLVVVAKNPLGLPGGFLSFGKSKPDGGLRPARDYQEAVARTRGRDEVDRILEKITAKGIQSLTAKERETLAAASKKTARPR